MMDILGNSVQDTLSGALWRRDGEHVLALSKNAIVLKGIVMAQSPLVVRYAVPFLGPKQFSVVPSVFVSEKGGMLYADKAWRFIYGNHQLYPRAEILGYRSDGEKQQVFLRELDFGDQPRVLVYENASQTVPIAEAQRVVYDGTVKPPALLLDILPSEQKET